MTPATSAERHLQPLPVPVGIDIAKARYDVMIHPHNADPVHQVCTTPEAVATMIAQHAPEGPIIAAMEYTGGMALPVLLELERISRIDIHIMQDADIAALRKVLNRPKKTDKLDADLIMRAMAAARVPETAHIFARFLTPWTRLREPIMARHIVRHTQALTKSQRSAKLRYGRAELDIQKQHHEATIAHHQRQIEEARNATIQAAAGPQAELLQTIPGISPYRAAVILAAIGDVTRFRTPDALVKYLGVVPRHRPTSGGAKQTGSATAVRGSDLLATEFFMWSFALPAQPHLYDGWAYTYERTKARRDAAGTRGRSPQWTVIRKLIRTIWHILTTQTPYDPDRTYPPGIPHIPMPKPTRTRTRKPKQPETPHHPTTASPEAPT